MAEYLPCDKSAGAPGAGATLRRVLDVRRLRVLREVGRHGSLSAAATALNYTPSAVSQQISLLEREVGQRLLERGSRGVVLTEAGRVLSTHAEAVLEALEAAEAALADLSALRGGRLRLASFATAAATIVPAAVETFRRLHPGIDVEVESATSVDGISRLRRGEVDLVLTVDQEPAGDLDVIALFDDPFRLAVSRSHPLASESCLTLAQLAAERWIDVPAAVAGGGVLPRAFGTAVRVAHQSEDYTAIHEMVGAGLGLALLPDLARLPANPDVVFCSLGADGPRRRVQAATRTQEVRSLATSAMLAVLRRYEPVSRPLTGPAVSANGCSEPSRYVGA